MKRMHPTHAPRSTYSTNSSVGRWDSRKIRANVALWKRCMRRSVDAVDVCMMSNASGWHDGCIGSVLHETGGRSNSPVLSDHNDYEAAHPHPSDLYHNEMRRTERRGAHMYFVGLGMLEPMTCSFSRH